MIIRRLRALGLTVLIPLAGCSPVFYAPNVANAPLLKDNGEVRVSVHVGGGNEVDKMFQGNVAWAATSKVGLYGSIYGANGSFTDTDGRTTSGSGHAVDLAGGYHGFFAGHFGLEALAGIQLGGSHTDYRGGTDVVDVGERKLFGQLNLGYRGRFFEAVFGQRVGQVRFTSINETSTHPGPRPQVVIDLMAARSNIMYEPSIALRIGRDPLKFTFDLGGAHNATHPDLPMDDAVVALGLVYTFKRK